MIDAAIILAGGRGSRLSPWPAPKCLLPVNGVPIIHRLVYHLSGSVNRIVVCTGYRANDVAASFRGRTSSAFVDFSDAGESATMGQRLLLARESTPGRILVCYGDELVDIDVPSLLAKHVDRIPNALTYSACPYKLPFGVVNGADIESRTVLVNVGFAIVEPECWPLLQPEDGLADWINRVPHRQCVVHEGRRATINSLSDLEHAEVLWW